MSETITISARNRIRASYGVNRKIEGVYNPLVAVKCFNGTFVGKQDEEILSFRGVPYAKPPVGSRRWKRPAPAAPNDGVYEAYYNGKSPIQIEWETEQGSYYPQGEDCLYLNIWLNRTDLSTKKPVMVYLHGGAFGWGGTADPMYDGANFVKQNPDIILVTVGYRIGLMGFVDFSELKGGSNFADAPNLGILDQIEALRWVQKNITFFGGDRKNVTVFGESAGGATVSLLPIIPKARGLFRRVISQSGSVALTYSKEECRAFTRKLIEETGIHSMAKLMVLPEKELMRLNEKLNSYNNFPQRDGKLIPKEPYKAYEDGMSAHIDMLIGTNSDESRYWIGEIGGIVPYRFSIPIKFENDMKTLDKKDQDRVKLFMNRLDGYGIWKMSEFYDEMMFRLPAVKQAECHSSNGGRVYMYYWTEPSAKEYCGACHAVELSYVFGNLDDTIFTGERGDEALSKQVMTMWANFARTGNPSVENLKWKRYDPFNRATMILCKDSHMQDDVLPEQRQLLFPLLRYMINPSYEGMSLNVPFVHKLVGVAALAAVGVIGLSIGIIRKLSGK